MICKSNSVNNMSSSRLLTVSKDALSNASRSWGLGFTHCSKQLRDISSQGCMSWAFGALDTHGPHSEPYLCFSLIEFVASFAQLFLTTCFILEPLDANKVSELLADNLSSTCNNNSQSSMETLVILLHVGFETTRLRVLWIFQLIWCPATISTHNSSFSYFNFFIY